MAIFCRNFKYDYNNALYKKPQWLVKFKSDELLRFYESTKD